MDYYYGGSTDGSKEIIEKYAARGCFAYWFSERENRIYHAMYKIAKATGEYYIFLNSGDCFSLLLLLRNL